MIRCKLCGNPFQQAPEVKFDRAFYDLMCTIEQGAPLCPICFALVHQSKDRGLRVKDARSMVERRVTLDAA